MKSDLGLSSSLKVFLIAASASICLAQSAPPVPSKSYNVSLTQGPEIPPVAAGTPPSYGYALIDFYGNSVNYKLYVFNGAEVTQGHIHYAAAGATGPVVAWLYPVGGTAPANPASGSVTNGLLAQGTLTDASLVNALKGKTIYDLYNYAANQQLYVNVHNRQNPEGFIRGQF
eukprot:jgi/Botrbrau1/2221/Bobra.101_2s0050.1